MSNTNPNSFNLQNTMKNKMSNDTENMLYTEIEHIWSIGAHIFIQIEQYYRLYKTQMSRANTKHAYLKCTDALHKCHNEKSSTSYSKSNMIWIRPISLPLTQMDISHIHVMLQILPFASVGDYYLHLDVFPFQG